MAILNPFKPHAFCVDRELGDGTYWPVSGIEERYMSGFSDLPDPKKVREMFEGAYGSEKGPPRFRRFLRYFIPLALIAVIGGLVLADWHLVKAAYSEAIGWFSLPSTAQGPSKEQPATGDCSISNSTINGRTEQHCVK